MKFNKQRAGILVGGLGLVGAVAATTLGGTSALFASEANGQSNQITAGSNVLTENAAFSTVVNATGFMPGDEKVNKYALKYVGNDAFVGLDVKITSTAQKACDAVAASDTVVTVAELSGCTAPGTQPMFNGDTSTSTGSLDLSVAPQNNNTFSPVILAGTLESAAKCASDAAKVVTCVSDVKNIPVPPGYIAADSANDLIWNDGKTGVVQVTSKLPLAAPNAFQGSIVKIGLVSHAVQSANNSVTVGSGQVDPKTTFGYGASGTGNQSTLLFPKLWS
jgi:hypothetical protein